MAIECNICSQVSDDGGPLSCGHTFCTDCFQRYVQGTVEELHSFARCCICGECTALIQETNSEPVVHKFGRETTPRLSACAGFCQVREGCVALLDTTNHQGHILDATGTSHKTFRLVYKYSVLRGITCDRLDRLVFPVLTRDCVNVFNTKRHVGLAYYNLSGQYLNSAFLPQDADVRDVAVNANNEVLCTDYARGCIHVVHERQRYLKSIQIPNVPGEHEDPKPWGITVSPVDGRIFVTDVANHSIKILSADGQYETKFGSCGERPGQFNHPTGISVNQNNQIVVADSGNNRVQLFDRDAVFERYIVRYNRDAHAYLQPTQVDFHKTDEDIVIVFLTSSKPFIDLSEVRMYKSYNEPLTFSC